MVKYFDLAIATIFAREVLEGAIVIGQYRTVLLRSPEWADPERQRQGLRAITVAALVSAFVAFLLIVAVATPIIILSSDLNQKVVQLVEGVSKLVAAVCVLELSVKIPKWLGIYTSKKTDEDGIQIGLTLKSIRFNVAWNIWREVAETGVYLIPFFVAGDEVAIPLSGVIGSVLALILGYSIYVANRAQKDMFWLVVFMASLTGLLSIGLFTGGAHEFEKALGETKQVWKLEGDFWSTDRLPMTVFKPFGYSSSRSILQIVCFWSWTILTLACHYRKYRHSEKIKKERELEGSTDDVGSEMGEGYNEDDEPC